MVKKQLLFSTPRLIRNLHIKEADPEAVAHGNRKSILSKAVYRKAKSEAFSDGHYHTISVLDIVLRAQEGDCTNYIQSQNGKTEIRLYSKEQLDLILDERTRVVLHFDATGSVVKPSEYDKGKLVYYYAGVVNIKNTMVPVVELISSKHDTSVISSLFFSFNHFIKA